MEIRTCEEFVLQTLKNVGDENEKLKAANKELIDTARYAKEVFGLFTQLCEMQRVTGEDGKVVYVIVPKFEKSVLDISEDNKTSADNDRSIYNLLAPVIGSAEVKAEIEAARKAANKEEA